MLPFSVEFIAGEPPEPQVELAVQRAVLSGQLPPGSKMPEWRVVSADLRMHPDAVRRVFDSLQNDGWLNDDNGQLRTALPNTERVERVRLKLVRDRARALYAEARVLNVSIEQVRVALKEEGGDV